LNSTNKKFFWSCFSIFLPIEVLAIVFVNLLPSFESAYVVSRAYLTKFPILLSWFGLMITRETITGYLILILVTGAVSVLISLTITVGIFLYRESIIREKSRNPLVKNQKQKA